ncbi:MAG: sigma-70 family RNA polymerase sigma factor [Acidobacteria bacterium]|nr:sigma-70 family RNA polymerase sigma factor [Acidobacteriota bacterium]
MEKAFLRSSFAFEQAAKPNYDLVYRTAYGITRTPEDAEDVVQMIFLQLLGREIPPDLTRYA